MLAQASTGATLKGRQQTDSGGSALRRRAGGQGMRAELWEAPHLSLGLQPGTVPPGGCALGQPPRALPAPVPARYQQRGVSWQATAGGDARGSTCPTDRQTWLAGCELCLQQLWPRPPALCARRGSPRAYSTICVQGCSSLVRRGSCGPHRLDCLVEGRAR